MIRIPRGAKPNKHDRRDYDFLRTKLGGIYPPFPEEYSTDAGLWQPDQNEGAPGIPPMPYGCTNYAQTDLLIDEDRKLYNPMDLENITHANANGGTDLRTSLKALVSIHPDHPAFFNVRPSGVLDWFDALRIAQVVGKLENRAVSVGSPWFPSFMDAPNGIVSNTDWTLTKNGLPRVTWHDWNVKGWKTINGEIYLIMKPWIGKEWGDKGFGYINRATFNRLMQINGTVAFVVDKLLPGEQPQKIDSTIAQWLVSFFAEIFHV